MGCLTNAGCIGPLQNSTAADGSPTSLYQPYDQSCSDPATGTTILYSQMIAQGVRRPGSIRLTPQYLTSDGSAGANGWRRYFDTCTQTPYLYSASKRQMITYDECADSSRCCADLAVRSHLLPKGCGPGSRAWRASSSTRRRATRQRAPSSRLLAAACSVRIA